MADKERTPFKESLNERAVDRLGRALVAADPAFPLDRFRELATRGLGPLSLKERVQHVIAALDACLPPDYPAALEIVTEAGQQFSAGDGEDPLSGMAAWALIDWVPWRGVDPLHFDAAISALAALTGLFSSEFAVRPFILHDPERAMVHLTAWTRHPAEQVRRLASEGCRPRLPWGQQLPLFRDDPAQVLALLERLRDDPTELVRRSVANNLNDISKDHPDQVVEVAARWMQDASSDRARLVAHALRSLVKAGHPGAMEALGFTTRPRVEARLELTEARLQMGQVQRFMVTLRSTGRQPQRLVVDYAVHHMKKRGQTSAKVFKLRTVHLDPGQEVTLIKGHRFAPRSVRRLYPGRHEIELLVAGQGMSKAAFELID